MWVKHGKTILNHPMFDGLCCFYCPFVYCFNHINRHWLGVHILLGGVHPGRIRPRTHRNTLPRPCRHPTARRTPTAVEWCVELLGLCFSWLMIGDLCANMCESWRCWLSRLFFSSEGLMKSSQNWRWWLISLKAGLNNKTGRRVQTVSDTHFFGVNYAVNPGSQWATLVLQHPIHSRNCHFVWLHGLHDCVLLLPLFTFVLQ